MDKGKKIAVDNWSFVNTEIFIQILFDEARKGQRTCSRNGRVLSELQWKEIHCQLLEKTGMGGIQSFKDPTYQPPALFVVTSDEEMEMYSKGKPIKMEDSGSKGSGKRKLGNAGGSSSKKERLDKKQEAYEQFAYANQMRVRRPPIMSTSGNPPSSHYSSDDDDLMDLEFLSMSDEDEVEKIPQRTFPVSGQYWTQFFMTEYPQTIKDLLCVDQHTFRSLVDLLLEKGQLKWDHMRLSVEESLAIFLYVCGQSERHRVAAHWFQHSTNTINRHFKLMRRAFCNVAPFVIRPPDLDVTPPEILNDGRYYPWFKDCVGAIDGTHIDAWVPESREVAYRGRNWEGSAHDDRVFLSTVTNPDFKFPKPPITRQPQIVTACCVVHNWIIIQQGRDEFFDGFNDDTEWEADGGHDNDDVDGVQANVEHVDMSATNVQLMAIRRDEIAEQLWEDY
ncbi:hypothetical protein Vadar_020591 [Vaccinium darrowii]|uniref:Uncharacterized protein n=1 Tax=Vaccinium darrowii TaxID=229202 RepID=A0ACB7Y8H7_9ERIC|nr:hypothetical protein Vadar_020591 [Vaccinium darrowii]